MKKDHRTDRHPIGGDVWLLPVTLERGVPDYAARVESTQATHDSAQINNASIEQVIAQQRSNLQVVAQGRVKKTLKDDNDGSRHQRFIVELPTGHTLLVAHNIDLADRIPDLQAGDAIIVSGEYVWNSQGGIMHWTHRDPAGRHATGRIKHKGHVDNENASDDRISRSASFSPRRRYQRLTKPQLVKS